MNPEPTDEELLDSLIYEAGLHNEFDNAKDLARAREALERRLSDLRSKAQRSG